jgi:hypothetical protein
MLILALSGCGGSANVGRGPGGGQVRSTAQQRTELLVNTIKTLFRLEAYEFGQAEELVMSRLNQWLRGQTSAIPWQREPRLEELPESMQTIRGVVSLADESFLYEHDFAFLREAVWMRRIGDHVRAEMMRAESAKDDLDIAATNLSQRTNSLLKFLSDDDPEELRLAMHLFEWTIKNIQLEQDQWPETAAELAYKLPVNWHTPYETVLIGRGTASDRAWVLTLLARQQGLDVVVLGLEDTEKPGELKPWLPALVLSRQGANDQATELYLFDPALGLPVPGPDGRGIATLAQAARDDTLLRQLDLDDKRPYVAHADDIQQVAVLVESSPGYLSRRMKFLESKLAGEQRLVLSVEPDAIKATLATAKHVRPKVKLWTRPYETLQLRETEDQRILLAARRELYPFQELINRSAMLSSEQHPILNHPAVRLWLSLSITRDEAKRRMLAEGIPENEADAVLSEAGKISRDDESGATARREDAGEYGGSHPRRERRASIRVPLGVGRMLQLAGDFGHESGALFYLQQATSSDAEQNDVRQRIMEMSADGNAAVRQQLSDQAASIVDQIRRSDHTAKLWIGQIKAESGEYETAINYFTSWENPLWQSAVDYGLARVYEARGETAKAIQKYREDESPQRHGNLLRARRLEKLDRKQAADD